MFQKRNNGRVRLQGGGDDEGWKTKEETDVTESKKYCKSLSLERSRLELRSVLYLYKRNKNKVFSFLIKFLFIFYVTYYYVGHCKISIFLRIRKEKENVA